MIPKQKVGKDEDKYFKGYSLQIDDSSLINDLGASLATLSSEDNMDNLGVVFLQKKDQKKIYKVQIYFK